jgi:two-component system osmolarity sensor histidine kinase EnvZ
MFSAWVHNLGRSWPRLARPREYWLRRVMPKSLFGRSLLIVLLPLLILQGMLAYVFYNRHWDTVTRWLTNGVAGDVAMLVDLLNTADSPASRQRILTLGRTNFGLIVSLEPGGRLAQVPGGADWVPRNSLERTMAENFARMVARPVMFDTLHRNDPDWIAVYIQLDDGLLRVLTPRKRVDSGTTTVFILWMVGLSLLLLAIAIFFLTRQIRPILRLVWAADNFGKGRDVGDFKLEGATEIRQAGAAFNLMRKRILRYIGQRTEMLAAVSHDLRTPLTRMKLELELMSGCDVKTEDLEGLRSDVEEMAAVVDGYLAFARGEGQEAMQPTDLGSLLQEVAERSTGQDVKVEVELEAPIELQLRPVAFRRCLANLLGNASRHARWIGIRATLHDDQVWIAIDDDGPGVPASQREAVFKPFFRLEPSRNPSTGGVGLGLTIARDIVLGHGGDIQLGEAPAGGLRVLIRLPC